MAAIGRAPDEGRLAAAGAMYEEKSGTSPKFTYKRMLGGGDIFVVEGTIDYGDGIPVSYVGIGEVRDGKVAKMTEYFANPFEAPAWRADFVEKMEPATACGRRAPPGARPARDQRRRTATRTTAARSASARFRPSPRATRP